MEIKTKYVSPIFSIRKDQKAIQLSGLKCIIIPNKRAYTQERVLRHFKEY